MSEDRSLEAARVALAPLIRSLKPAKARLLQYLLDRFGVFVTRRELVDDALPGFIFEHPGNAVGVHLADLRELIAAKGFEIEGKATYGSRLKWKTKERSAA